MRVFIWRGLTLCACPFEAGWEWSLLAAGAGAPPEPSQAGRQEHQSLWVLSWHGIYKLSVKGSPVCGPLDTRIPDLVSVSLAIPGACGTGCVQLWGW